MIIQSADQNGRQFIIKNMEHAALAGQFAQLFGNRDFDIPEPRDDIHYIIVNHDYGWQALDDNPPIEPDTGLPYNLVHTPLKYMLETSTASPDFNEQHSPFCGLISSMHTYGLYTGRYGLSNAISMDWIPQEMQAAVNAMLQHELNRQEKLKKNCAIPLWLVKGTY